MVWQNSNLQSQNSSQAPFTVIFHCADSTVYGTVTGVASAGMVMASTAHGNRFCKPVKKKGKQQGKQGQDQGQSGKQGQGEQSEDLNEKQQQQLEEYFKEKPDPEVQFKPKSINPQQWSDQDRF